MATVLEKQVSNGRGAAIPRSSLSHLAIGKIVTTNLAAARSVYERFFAFECVQYAPGRLLMRDRRARWQMENGDRDFFLIDVHEVSEISNPQANLNHWGFTVSSQEEVVRIREFAISNAERFRFAKVHPITKIHNAYGFYFYDLDSNWWEVEYRGGRTNDGYFSSGDWNAERTGNEPVIDPPILIADTPSEVFGPDAFMTHGTTDVVDADAARRFYEDILRLRSVRHARPAQFTAGAGDFAFVGVQAAARNAIQTPDNSWVVLVDGEESLLSIHRAAESGQGSYGLLEVTQPAIGALGHLSFLIRNADENWFEVSTLPPDELVSMFKRAA